MEFFIVEDEREIVVVDVLAGICGLLFLEVMSFCIISLVDFGDGN